MPLEEKTNSVTTGTPSRRPGLGKILISKIEEERKTSSGLVLSVHPDEAPTQKAIILAIGEVKGTYVVGDYCYIIRRAGWDIGMDELCIREEEILYSESR